MSPYQPTRETGLIRLLPGLAGALGSNLDMMRPLLKLLDSYLLLDAAGIIQVSLGHHVHCCHKTE